MTFYSESTLVVCVCFDVKFYDEFIELNFENFK